MTPERGRLPMLSAGWWHSVRAAMLAGLVAAGPATAAAPGQFLPAHTERPVVFVVPINGVIDLGLAPFVERVLDEAATTRATAVILQINTFGGRVDAAVIIRDALLRSRVQTVAFVDKRAISAGALISLAAERIAMVDAGTIGAATPIEIGAPGGPVQPVAEKTVAYVRKEFRATAESRRRPALLAEAMVDADVEVPGLNAKGKLLTLTTEEALRHGMVDFRADSVDEVLMVLGLPGAEIRRVTPAWAERLVRFLIHPVIASLLTAIGILGIAGGLGRLASAWGAHSPSRVDVLSDGKFIEVGEPITVVKVCGDRIVARPLRGGG